MCDCGKLHVAEKHMEKHYVIVGLGNPGKQYEFTRHNMGYLVVQALAHSQGWEFKEDKQYRAFIAKGKVGNVTIHLLLPLTYMNESGWAVRRYLDFFKLTADNIIVISDDVALLYGDMRVRTMGSAGGHNGLKSIQSHMHTSHYVRLRMGIGRKNEAQTQSQEGVVSSASSASSVSSASLADYVLDKFSKEELQELSGIVEKAVQVVKRLTSETTSAVMNTVNVKQKKVTPT